MYYAIFDTTVSPSNPGYGFCNSKRVLCFSKKKDMEKVLRSRQWFDFSESRIYRREAMKYLEYLHDDCYGLVLDRTDGTVRYRSGDRYIVFKPSDRMYEIVQE